MRSFNAETTAVEVHSKNTTVIGNINAYKILGTSETSLGAACKNGILTPTGYIAQKVIGARRPVTICGCAIALGNMHTAIETRSITYFFFVRTAVTEIITKVVTPAGAIGGLVAARVFATSKEFVIGFPTTFVIGFPTT